MDKKEFETFVNKIVEVKDNYPTMRSYLGGDINWKVPLPKTNKEFKVFTKKYYGVELNIDVVVVGEGITYKIKESQSEYSQGELMKLWNDKFGQYDGLKILLKALFGELTCGGVAGSHYGQTKLEVEKRILLLNWDGVDNRLKIVKKMKEQDKDLKDIFGVNPFD